MQDRPTTVIVHFHAKPGHGEELWSILLPAVPRLREIPGCMGGSLYHDIDSPNTIVLIEHWRSVEAHQRYVEQVEADGTMDTIRPLMSGSPERRYLGKR